MIVSLLPFQRRDNYLFVRLASSINICLNENYNYFIDNIKLARPFGNVQRIFFDLFIGLTHFIPSCSMISIHLHVR